MFYILDLGNLEESTKPIVDQAFDIWFGTYQPILNQAGEKLLPEYFHRSKLLTAIYANGRVEAFLLHNFYDVRVRGIMGLGYFDQVTEEMKEKIHILSTRIFSCEFVTVHPELRTRFSKVQFGDLMMGLAFKTMLDSHCDSAMGFSRLDNKADQMAEKFGFLKLGFVERHGKQCGVMHLQQKNLKPHPYNKTNEKIEELYASKQNFSPYINSKEQKNENIYSQGDQAIRERAQEIQL